MRALGYLSIFFLCFNQAWANSSIKSTNPATMIRIDSGEKIILPAGESREITVDRPLLIESEGRLPMILVPVPSNSEVILQSPTVESALMVGEQKRIDAELSELMLGYSEIQKNILAKQNRAAKVQLERLQAKYPRVRFLDFVKASILYVLGDRAGAQAAAKSAAEAHPNYTEGQEFLKMMEGKKND